MSDRETLEVDVLIVGAGPAGLACALHLGEQARWRASPKLSILVIEKGAGIGAHTLSGAVLDPLALDELVPSWRQHGAPVRQPVTSTELLFLTDRKATKVPHCLVPEYLNNRGNYVVSVCELVRWLAEQAKERGVEILEGVAGSEVLSRGTTVLGVRCADSGLSKDGQPKPNFQPGADIRAKVTVLAEGSHGSLARQFRALHDLDTGRLPQTYSLGLKELWELPPGVFPAGKIVHTFGFPLQKLQALRRTQCFGGGFLYGLDGTHVAAGLVVGLDYVAPRLDPHAEFNRWKSHPYVRALLEKGTLVEHGAKALAEGGYYAMPRLYACGCCMVGDSAGFVNVARGKGIHLAMKSGMLAAEAIAAALARNDCGLKALGSYEDLFQMSWARSELYSVRNWRAGFAQGVSRGVAHDLCQRFSESGGKVFSRDPLPLKAPSQTLARRAALWPVPLPPGKSETLPALSKETAVFHSGTQAEEDQPCHLKVQDLQICVQRCAPEFGQPCQYCCPAGVYEWQQDSGLGPALHLNPSNCLHCKACDIKDPYGNILWTVPEGGGGPRYQRM
ncbi:MAG: electron transfer flavoprotein-ubiquinone oxidoreductase [Planctomycetota bacterium]